MRMEWTARSFSLSSDCYYCMKKLAEPKAGGPSSIHTMPSAELWARCRIRAFRNRVGRPHRNIKVSPSLCLQALASSLPISDVSPYYVGISFLLSLPVGTAQTEARALPGPGLEHRILLLATSCHLLSLLCLGASRSMRATASSSVIPSSR